MGEIISKPVIVWFVNANLAENLEEGCILDITAKGNIEVTKIE
jgi:hypothetical protein